MIEIELDLVTLDAKILSTTITTPVVVSLKVVSSSMDHTPPTAPSLFMGSFCQHCGCRFVRFLPPIFGKEAMYCTHCGKRLNLSVNINTPSVRNVVRPVVDNEAQSIIQSDALLQPSTHPIANTDEETQVGREVHDKASQCSSSTPHNSLASLLDKLSLVHVPPPAQRDASEQTVVNVIAAEPFAIVEERQQRTEQMEASYRQQRTEEMEASYRQQTTRLDAAVWELQRQASTIHESKASDAVRMAQSLEVRAAWTILQRSCQEGILSL